MIATASSNPHLTGAILLMTQSLGLGLYMSLGFRVKMRDSKDAAKSIVGSTEFKIASSVQLNNAEWTPLFVAAMLYLHSKGSGSFLSAALSVVSCVSFVAVKIALFPGRITPFSFAAATARYIALALLIFEVAKA